jgi:hypothetical protein
MTAVRSVFSLDSRKLSDNTGARYYFPTIPLTPDELLYNLADLSNILQALVPTTRKFIDHKQLYKILRSLLINQ